MFMRPAEAIIYTIQSKTSVKLSKAVSNLKVGKRENWAERVSEGGRPEFNSTHLFIVRSGGIQIQIPLQQT
jgi:hypothetical protein